MDMPPRTAPSPGGPLPQGRKPAQPAEARAGGPARLPGTSGSILSDRLDQGLAATPPRPGGAFRQNGIERFGVVIPAVADAHGELIEGPYRFRRRPLQ
jgi:hypothetical protein